MSDKTMNFVSGGMMGDFIHSLFALKNICERMGIKAKLYLINDGDIWRFGIDKAYQDLAKLVESQPYIESFGIIPQGFNEQYVDMNSWRKMVGETHARTGSYNKCWTEVLSEHYGFDIPAENKWVHVDAVDPVTQGKLVIHRSYHRQNAAFPWNSVLNEEQGDILFVTSNILDWERFGFKRDNVKLHLVSTIWDMAVALNSSKMFVGNQSTPFALASALEIPRFVELDHDPSKFYMDEIKYSKNISWFLNDKTLHKINN